MGNLSLSNIIVRGGGGAPNTTASFYSAKLCTLWGHCFASKSFSAFNSMPVPTRLLLLLNFDQIW